MRCARYVELDQKRVGHDGVAKLQVFGSPCKAHGVAVAQLRIVLQAGGGELIAGGVQGTRQRRFARWASVLEGEPDVFDRACFIDADGRSVAGCPY
jgi:hypothetical protein